MEAHEPVGFFTPKYKMFNRYIEMVLSLFYGHVPYTYRIGHNKFHHATPTNGPHDYLCTRHYRRDSVKAAIDYLGKFSLGWNGISIVDHAFRHNLGHLGWYQIKGMMYYLAVIGLFGSINWKFTLAYIIFPNIEACNYLAGINFVWHAFAESNQPDNEYIESCTILNGWYNVYNMDYHLVHHENPTMQFTDIPAAYEKDLDNYKLNRASIVTGTHEFELFFWIILQRYDLIAERWVDLSGEMTRDEILTMIKRRLATVDPRGDEPTLPIPRPLIKSSSSSSLILESKFEQDTDNDE
jgi:fatty acid desaturase